jgi:hypothetical protein
VKTSLPYSAPPRQSLGKLLGEHHAATVELNLRDEHGWAHGNLDAHLASLAAQIAAHPESSWVRLECVEEARLR